MVTNPSLTKYDTNLTSYEYLTMRKSKKATFNGGTYAGSLHCTSKEMASWFLQLLIINHLDAMVAIWHHIIVSFKVLKLSYEGWNA